MNKDLSPSTLMVEGLLEQGEHILGSVNESAYSSYYTIARELGMFYDDSNGYFVSDLVTQYEKDQLSYRDYLKYYILNTELLINDKVVHPFDLIVESINKGQININDLSSIIELYPNQSSKDDSHLKRFLKRCVEANLINKSSNDYTLVKPYDLIKKSINKSGLSASDFNVRYIGPSNQKNIVEMVSKAINTGVLDDHPQTNVNTQENMPKFPLNQILYGPPGTGKTYSTIKKSLEILDKVSESAEENYETFKSLLNKRIFFVTMHPSFSYEDFVQGVKPETNDKGELVFKVKDGIFKTVADKANKSVLYEEDNDIQIVDEEGKLKLTNKEILTIAFFISKFNDRPELKANLAIGDSKAFGKTYEIIAQRTGVNSNTIKNYRDKFDFLTTEQRNGWPPRNGSNDTLDNTLLWPFNDVYQELKDLSFEDVESKVIKLLRLGEQQEVTSEKEIIETEANQVEDNLNYVLILDEINRANISKVFGELITLLEEDKRMGAELEMSVLLPSGEEFSIPSNLYIIGTMNTADKSIALVDIALRRRFQFEAMYPDEKVIQDFIEDAVNKEKHDKKIEFFKAINTYLRKDKGVDFQIGHAYFLNERNINEIINQNILPLLVEYYRNDSNKVKKIMNEIDFALDDTHFDNTGLLKYNGE
ncbi:MULTISPECIES: McrB family protein [Myroides]|uniref:McrB family protein n=1 Tax=Myroides TaxID=76831 RepID=UPI0025765C00|nr:MULTISPECIES: AAA family ATPase [Myroides]MDM1353263.1 AAA family ATPase [Myroides marinus]MDM1461181.1 AAA family ATPase [Myroides odoratimimus]